MARRLGRALYIELVAQMSNCIPNETNVQTLDLLREAHSYLCSLPAHPMTRALVQRIDAHLDDPSIARAQKVEKLKIELEARRAVQMSEIWKPNAAGVPLLVVALSGDELEITSPRAAQFHGSSAGRQLAIYLAKELAAGVKIKLDKGPFWGL